MKQVIRCFSAVSAALVLTISTAAHAATYWVATTGNDSNNGSEVTPWRTIQRSTGTVQPGDTVRVKAGTYSGFVLGWDVAGQPSGTPSAPITFEGEAGATITQPNSRTADGINLEGVDYVTVRGFTVRGQITNGVSTIGRAGIRSVQNEGVRIFQNSISDCGSWGIITGYSQNLLIEGNSTSGSIREHGIYVGNSAANSTLRGNRIFNNRGNGIHMNGDASITSSRSFAHIPNFEQGMIKNALVEGNIIFGNGLGGGSAINCDGCENAIIQNNLAYDNVASGISLYVIDAAGPATNNLVVNNTVIQPSSGRWPLNIKGGSVGNEAFNNIFIHLGTRGSIALDTASAAQFTSNYNVVVNRFTRDDDATWITLDQWRQQTGNDANSVLTSSGTYTNLFVNASGKDFHLSASSSAIDAGRNDVAPPTDLDNALRPVGARVDIGAYEYGAGASSTPTPSATSTATFTPTYTATPTSTATPTPTVMPASTSTPTPGPTATPTFTPTATPTKRRGRKP